ncbi:MAG: hypothetical protein HN356_07380 [Calditrichaeota bacterium]|nr:hypothetical protein [Calditrichota bacterium]
MIFGILTLTSLHFNDLYRFSFAEDRDETLPINHSVIMSYHKTIQAPRFKAPRNNTGKSNITKNILFEGSWKCLYV